MRLFFGGAEINSHHDILKEQGAKHVSMSYMGLRRRVKFKKPWRVQDRIDPSMAVFLDSGAYTINHDDEADPDELMGIYEHYQTFVMDNLDDVDMVSEFDALPLGMDWIEEQRDEFWKDVPREKFMAVWHPVWGTSYLNEMASRYEIIGIPATALDGRELRPILNALAVKGTRLHGIAMTKVPEMQSIRWDSVASTSWISPQRYGDTIVWTGNELKRYPMKMKERARKQHRTLFTNNGFDAEAIANDDPTEVLKLSVWSWQKFEEYVNRHASQGRVVTPLFSNDDRPIAQPTPDAVGTQPETDVEGVATPESEKAITTYREPSKMLPVMGLTQADPDSGEEEGEHKPQITIRSESARVCNTCFLSEKCPGYEPDSNCVYNIPVTVRNREQFKALNYGMLEMQTQRVLFMRFSEEIEGGYADPNLSKEMGLLNKVMAQTAELEKDGFNLNINVRGSASQSAEGSMMSRIFGSQVSQGVQELEAGPQPADDIIEGQILSETQDG